jgi:hypothetical protein
MTSSIINADIRISLALIMIFPPRPLKRRVWAKAFRQEVSAKLLIFVPCLLPSQLSTEDERQKAWV